MAQVKTGEVYWVDDAGVRWLAESFEDENGVVTTTQTEVPPETLVVDMNDGNP